MKDVLHTKDVINFILIASLIF